jgi:CheY-like chemotaxis protein
MLPPGGPVADDVDQVLEAAHRGAALVRQLLAFSRHRPVELKVVDVNALLTALLPMVRRLLGEDLEVALVPGEVWKTRIDPGGLEQIVINMAVNARDAMPRGGRLTISTQNMTFEEELPISRREGLVSGDYVVLAISDEGEGIPPEAQEHIFEPFFTTKEVGRGTGLGLSTCWGIARQAGGSISVYSELGSGTTFKVYMPRCTSVSDSQMQGPALSHLLDGNETVLVIEDDAQVRALTARALRKRGYDVLEASSRAEADAWVEQRGEDIQLILADVVMPEMSGPDLVAGLRERLPHACVLYMSGYTGAAVARRGLLEQGAPILEKPFTPELLSRKVRDVLNTGKR